VLDPIEVFEIDRHQIKATTHCFITIDRNEYREEDINDSAEFINLPGVLTFVFPEQDGTAHLTYPYQVRLMKSKDVEDDETLMTIHYAEGDVIIDQQYADDSVNMGTIVSMMHGRLAYIKDPKTLVLLLHKQLPGADLVHLELIISNIMHTEKGDKCRYTGNYKDSVMLSQTQVSFNNSWLSSMSYRNIDRAIAKGLVQGKDIENNPIENIINEHYTDA